MDLEKSIFFQKNKWFSITICPKDTYQYFGKEERLRKFRNMLNELLLSVFQSSGDYRMYIELSEPRSKTINGPRLHSHGIFRFKDDKSVLDFLLLGYYNLTRIGIIDIDDCKDIIKWHRYCTKQITITKIKCLSNMDIEMYKEILQKAVR